MERLPDMNKSANNPLFNCDMRGYKKNKYGSTVKAAGTTGTWLVLHLYLRGVLRARHGATVTQGIYGDNTGSGKALQITAASC